MARAASAIAAGFVLAATGVMLWRIWAAVGANSLWLDEFATMGFAYMSGDAPTRWSHHIPDGPLRWFALLSSAIDPHFPTIYGLTRGISALFPGEGMSLEHFVRSPMVLLVSIGICAVAAWLLRARQAPATAVLAAAILLILASDQRWREHSAEARMYGLMTVLGVCLVVAAYRQKVVAASWIGLGLVLLHPFGAMFGFVPAAVTLLVLRRRIGRRAAVALLCGTVATSLLAAGWMVAKFVLRAPSDFAVQGRSDDVLRMLAGLDGGAILFCVAAVVAATSFAWRQRRADAATLLIFLLMLGSAAAFVGALVVLRPTTPPHERYVAWSNPVFLAMGVASLALLAGQWRGRGATLAGAVLACALAAVSMRMALTGDFGPPWGHALRDAAAHISASVDDRSAVVHDSAEMFDIPPAFRRGFRCFRGGQAIAYLRPEARILVPCQLGDTVVIPAGVEQVFLLREPVAFLGTRRILLDGFGLAQTRRFGGATVEVYQRQRD